MKISLSPRTPRMHPEDLNYLRFHFAVPLLRSNAAAHTGGGWAYPPPRARAVDVSASGASTSDKSKIRKGPHWNAPSWLGGMGGGVLQVQAACSARSSVSSSMAFTRPGPLLVASVTLLELLSFDIERGSVS